MRARNYDLVVVGAGPAGAAAAFTAASAGLRVALVDHMRFPRDKLCGGLITGRSLRYYREIFGVSLAVDPLECKTVIEFRFQGRPAGIIGDMPPLFLSMRRSLDHQSCAKALARGAEDMTGQAIAGIDLNAKQIRLKDGPVLGYRVLIGADGVNSMVARSLFGESFDRRYVGFGLEIEETDQQVSPDAPISIDIAACDWGYGWCFPKRCSTTIGVGGVLARNPDIKASMRAYLTSLGLKSGAGAVKGQFLPFGDYRRRPGRDAVLLAGDAAGLVDPITGEGIAYAMKSGQLAARAAIGALQSGRPDHALRIYRHMIRPIHRSIRTANLLRRIIFMPVFQGAFELAFRQSDTVRRQYLQLLAGQVEYGAILIACLRRAPRLARLIVARRSRH